MSATPQARGSITRSCSPVRGQPSPWGYMPTGVQFTSTPEKRSASSPYPSSPGSGLRETRVTDAAPRALSAVRAAWDAPPVPST